MSGFFSRLFRGGSAAPASVRAVTPPPRPIGRPVAAAPKPQVVAPAQMKPANDPEAPRVETPRTFGPAVEALVENVRQLPLFSATAMQLMRSTADEGIAIDELARLISTDAGLTAALLRIVNSPYYALPRPCATVSEAIAVMGFDQVRRTVSAAVTKRPLGEYLRDSSAVKTYWRHQLLCASLARHIAKTRDLDGELAYMAGLMHEIGRLALIIHHPHLTEVLLNVEAGADHLGTQQERRHLGYDHAEVGGALLAKWGLPRPIVDAACDHEGDAPPADPISAVVWRANLLAHDMVKEPDEVEVATPWMNAVRLSVEDRKRIVGEIAALESGQG
jgi:HD-like signal output (HDOD) protein